MPDTDLHRPCLAPLRAAAEAAELAQAVSGLVSIDGCRLADTDPLAPLARSIARSMTEAGLTMHHCARHHPLYRLGGVFPGRRVAGSSPVSGSIGICPIAAIKSVLWPSRRVSGPPGTTACEVACPLCTPKLFQVWDWCRAQIRPVLGELLR